MPPSEDPALSYVMIEILVSLSREPLHGYAIKLDVEERIRGGFVLGSGSLYQALQRLQRRGLISEVPGLVAEDGRRGRTYRIEPEGGERLKRELERMDRVLADARRYDVTAGERAS
jgi:DNA-binding PadR family transcriptional regulator